MEFLYILAFLSHPSIHLNPWSVQPFNPIQWVLCVTYPRPTIRNISMKHLKRNPLQSVRDSECWSWQTVCRWWQTVQLNDFGKLTDRHTPSEIPRANPPTVCRSLPTFSFVVVDGSYHVFRLIKPLIFRNVDTKLTWNNVLLSEYMVGIFSTTFTGY